jgi:hypothetical protein
VTRSEAQHQLLLGTGRDPITGDPLGRAYPVYKTIEERIRDRVIRLNPGLSVDERATAVTAIEDEEASNTPRRAIAGYEAYAKASLKKYRPITAGR